MGVVTQGIMKMGKLGNLAFKKLSKAIYFSHFCLYKSGVAAWDWVKSLGCSTSNT